MMTLKIGKYLRSWTIVTICESRMGYFKEKGSLIDNLIDVYVMNDCDDQLTDEIPRKGSFIYNQSNIRNRGRKSQE